MLKNFGAGLTITYYRHTYIRIPTTNFRREQEVTIIYLLILFYTLMNEIIISITKFGLYFYILIRRILSAPTIFNIECR